MEVKRLLAISDPHGCFNLLRNLLEKVVRFNPSADFLVCCGDILDRGSQSMECVLYLSDLREKYPDRVQLLMGNHEYNAWASLTSGNGTMEEMRTPLTWIADGGAETIKSFGGIDNSREVLLPFVESLSLYFETPDYIFVHGGIPAGARNIEEEVPVRELLWNRDMAYDGDKLLICGHTVHKEITNYGKVICIDTGAYFYHTLSCFDVLNMRAYWIEDKPPVPEWVERN